MADNLELQKLKAVAEKSKEYTDSSSSDALTAAKAYTDSEKANYVLKTGDTMTGTLNVPVINGQDDKTKITIATGENSSSYFQSRKFRGQGDANTYNHAVDFGYAGHDRVDFYEYGGVFNFWANRGTSKLEGDSNRVASLQSGKLLERGYTLTYPGKSGTFALTSDLDAKLDDVLLVNDDNGKATVNELYRPGCLAVDTVTRRNDIDMNKLTVGTRCYVKNDEKFYRLTVNSSGSRMWTDDNETETFDSYASSDKHGTVMIGDNLKKDDSGKLTVDVADKEEKDSTKPISSGAVYNILGDIKTVLDNI